MVRIGSCMGKKEVSRIKRSVYCQTYQRNKDFEDKRKDCQLCFCYTENKGIKP